MAVRITRTLSRPAFRNGDAIQNSFFWTVSLGLLGALVGFAIAALHFPPGSNGFGVYAGVSWHRIAMVVGLIFTSTIIGAITGFLFARKITKSYDDPPQERRHPLD